MCQRCCPKALPPLLQSSREAEVITGPLGHLKRGHQCCNLLFHVCLFIYYVTMLFPFQIKSHMLCLQYLCMRVCVRACVTHGAQGLFKLGNVLQLSHNTSPPSISLVTRLSVFTPTIQFSENATFVWLSFPSTCTMANYCVDSVSSKDRRPEEADRSSGKMGDGKGAWPRPVVTQVSFPFLTITDHIQ